MRFEKLTFTFVAALLVIGGCATSPNRANTGEYDSLNARMSNLQNQMSSKDAEIARLQSELNSQASSLRQMESENEALNRKLNDASAKMASAAQPAVKKYDSDLK